MASDSAELSSVEQLEALHAEGKISDDEYTSLHEAMGSSVPVSPGVRKGRLSKSWRQRELGGVCGGIAQHAEISVTMVRLLFLLAFFMSAGAALLIYVGLYYALPWDEAPHWRKAKFSWAFAIGTGLGFLALNAVVVMHTRHLVSIFEHMGASLPWLTRAAINTANLVQTAWLPQLAVYAIVVAVHTMLPPAGRARTVLSACVCLLLLGTIVLLLSGGMVGVFGLSTRL